MDLLRAPRQSAHQGGSLVADEGAKAVGSGYRYGGSATAALYYQTVGDTGEADGKIFRGVWSKIVNHPVALVAKEKYGATSRLAARLGVSRQSLSNAIRKGKFPLAWVRALSHETGIPLWELRPDIYREDDARRD